MLSVLFVRNWRGNLELETLNLIGILGPLERVLVLITGVSRLADLAVGVAQVLSDSRVAVGQVNGAFQLVNRFLVLALLVVNPAKTVNVESIFGFDHQRALDQLLGFRKIRPFFGV